jgi:hypothetical protein
LCACGSTGGAAPDTSLRDAAIDSAIDGSMDAGEDAALDEDSASEDEACSGVPRGFACDGTTWRLCDLGEPWSIDCAAPPRGGSSGRCAQISLEHGYACVVPTGGGCRMEVAHGTHAHVFIASCEGSEGGCLVRERGAGFEGVCVDDLGSCSIEDVDRCRGQRLVTRCVRGQAVAMDCAELGGRCAPGSCEALPIGAPCGSALRCREGLRCARASRRELFRCAPSGEEDAGLDGG